MAQKVLVGMSGGVDSSVAAALLKQQGYEVIGATMKMWSDEFYNNVRQSGGCCSLNDINDAKEVANVLGIPHYVLNFKDYFKENVVEYFVKAYLEGKTPNPCIACNRYVKFEELLRRAEELGCDYIATGHYAHIDYNQDSGRYELKRCSHQKDQSYVLYNMTQYELAHTKMPLWSFTKQETRQLAEKFHLPVFNKHDSQEICFIEDNDYAGFIGRYTGEAAKEGNFVDKDGRILGRHKGIYCYTIGQRKGLGISSETPLYVIGIDKKANTVILGHESEQYRSSLTAEDINLIPFETLESEMDAEVKIRYNAKPVNARLIPIEGGKIRVIFESPVKSITPGQAVVFYQGEKVLGGGTISAEGTISSEGTISFEG